MYLPAYFEESRTEVLHAMMRGRPLTTLIIQCDSGIVANHIPVQTLTDPAPHGMLRGHIARANPLWKQYRADTEALAIFQGPQVYISPSFYPSKLKNGEVVPTWDYAVVHARGHLRFVEDAEWLHALVGGLTDSHESRRSKPWKVADAPLPYIEKMLSLIVGFELPITSITGKWKISQNHAADNRRGVVDGLDAAPDADSREIAGLLSAFNVAAGGAEQSSAGTVIQTDRLLLRELRETDAAFILELLNEEGFVRFIGDKGVRSLADARDYIHKGPIESYRRNGFGLYLSSLREGTPIGICGLVKRDGLGDADIGFAFLTRYQSKGYAAESAAAVLAHGLGELNLRRVVAITSPDNAASMAVLQKIGLHFEQSISLDPARPSLNLFATTRSENDS